MRWSKCVSWRVVAYGDGRAAEDRQRDPKDVVPRQKDYTMLTATYNLTNNVMYGILCLV